MLTVVGGSDVSPPRSHVAIIVPARFGSTRFPGKPLAPLRGADGVAKSLVERTWNVARGVGGVDEIWVATDDHRIADEARRIGARVAMTSSDCRNGTERCWDAVRSAGIDADIIVNLQGDAPLTPPLAIEALIDIMIGDPSIAVATPMIRCSPLQLDRLMADARSESVGGTTVVCNRADNALYFSKRVIPFVPCRAAEAPVHMHLGVYGYRRQALADYADQKPSPLELVEGLEQLRFLHAGITIRMVEVCDPPGGLWEVNNPADIVMVEMALAERHLV